MIVENLAGRFTEWNAEFEAFEGSTPDMLRYCMRIWWERVGSTKVSGITKLMMSEGRNFPELAEFYRREVVRPGHALLRRILRRGIERGEFAPVDVDHAIYADPRADDVPDAVEALGQHLRRPRTSSSTPRNTSRSQAETVLHGLVRAGREGGA